MQVQTAPSARVPKLVAQMATTEAEVREAQALRYLVFAQECAARLPSAALQLDCDRYDPHCRHLLVREAGTGEVVGSYRLLDYEGARAAGGFYCESEFDVSRIRHLGRWTVEIGRACVHPAYRGGATIGVLWSALIRHILL